MKKTRFLLMLVACVFAGLSFTYVTSEFETSDNWPRQSKRVVGTNIGDEAPELAFAGPDGKTLKPSSLRGKYVLVDFWASWCPPCRVSMPELESLHKEFPADRFTILAVNLDEDRNKALKFLERVPVSYPILIDTDGEVPARYQLPGMPTGYLLNASGVVLQVHKGYRPGDKELIRQLVIENLK